VGARANVAASFVLSNRTNQISRFDLNNWLSSGVHFEEAEAVAAIEKGLKEYPQRYKVQSMRLV
jgi:hypothetical protein